MPKAEQSHSIIPIERIAASIYLIRGQKVMLDSDLADLFDVTTGNLNKAVRRNINRFPEDFMFQLKEEEYESLIFQIGISNTGRGGRRTMPFVFTEQGVAMLSGVLNSERAIEVNILIIRTFIRLRQLLSTNEDILKILNEHDRQIQSLYAHVEKLLKLPDPKSKPIGYIWNE